VRVHVRIPATSANLGPGFDALGLALALHNEVVAEVRDGVSVKIDGEGADRLARDGANVVARGVKLAYEAAGRAFRGCALECVNRIPTSRGLGSSAAAWVGGLVAGNALLGSPLSKDALLGLAARAEGHPDNVAAAIFGGLTVSCGTAEGVTSVTLPVTKSLAWVVLVPEVTSATAEARALLPRSVPREDAVFNVQRVALLLAGLQTAVPAALAAARAAGALGCVLSGAGPSLLAVVAGDGGAVGRAMEDALSRAGVRGRAQTLDVDSTGATSRIS
jgi:homoserine kinase